MKNVRSRVFFIYDIMGFLVVFMSFDEIFCFFYNLTAQC